MKRTNALFAFLLFPLTGAAQGVLLDDLEDPAAPEMPELQEYSVEVIVFAYTEDVHAGTEIFVPELLPEPELLYDENGFPILGPIDGESIDGEGLDPETGLPLAEEPEEPLESMAAEDSVADEPEIEEPVTFTFELMLEEDYELLDMLSRLDELDAYEPLMHFGWIQGMLPDAETEVLTLETFDVPPYGLEGQFTLYLSRYLHLVVDLELAADREVSDELGEGIDRPFGDESTGDTGDPYRTEPTVREDSEPAAIFTDRRFGGGWETFPEPQEPRYAPLTYQISEDRIVRNVRNGEVRYYDHPKFGVIARVVRIEADEEELPDEVEEDAAQPASAFTQ